jgi:hypothetical protein
MLTGVTFAQDGATSSGSSTTAEAYQQEEQTLIGEYQALVSQGATQQQLQAWHQQNAPQFQAQHQRVQALSAAFALQLEPVASGTNIPANTPANASPTLQAFLATRASLVQAHALLHNQLVQAMPPGATLDQIDAMRSQERQLFFQKHAADLQLQQQRAQTLAAESAAQPLPVLGTTFIPPNATPQLKAFIPARDALMKSWMQVFNQYRTADPAVRSAAIQQWRQQNAASIQQLRQLAQNLSTSTAN